MIGIVILNYENWIVTQKCVQSIFDNPPNDDYRIVIIDNGSKNESANQLESAYKNDDRVVISMLPHNLGFAKGNNVGLDLIKEMGITYCVLTNSDILFHNGTIERMISDLRDNNAVIVGPKIVNNGQTQHSSRLKKGRLIDALEIGRFFPIKQLNECNEKGLHDVFSVSGCCFAIDLCLFKQMGAFDEKTFLYNEENILGIQAESKGFRTIIDLDIIVQHEHGASSGRDNDFVRLEYIKSTLYYWYKYRGKGRAVLKLILNAYVLKLHIKHNPLIHPCTIRKEGNAYIRDLLIS